MSCASASKPQPKAFSLAKSNSLVLLSLVLLSLVLSLVLLSLVKSLLSKALEIIVIIIIEKVYSKKTCAQDKKREIVC